MARASVSPIGAVLHAPVERGGEGQCHVAEAAFLGSFGELMGEPVRCAMGAQHAQEFGAVEIRPGCAGLRRRRAQAANQPVVENLLESADQFRPLRHFLGGIVLDDVVGVGDGRIERRAYHDAAGLGALARDDDGLVAHFVAHLAQGLAHVPGDEGSQLHGLDLSQGSQTHGGVDFVLRHDDGLGAEPLDDRAHERTDLRARQQHRHVARGARLRRNARASSG